ncbi:MAG: disulfide bond formation protein B [Candidatus Pacebacteria bacterium]|nr:disulfide bond formation protein B [Candidatus Paceibacterota bacterium]
MQTILSIVNFGAGIATIGFLLFSVLLAISLVFKNNVLNTVRIFASKHVLILGLVVSTTAVLGSLFYSEIIGYEPCALCWWARIFIYPTALLFAMALRKKDRSVLQYTLIFSILGFFFSLYHNYLSWGGSDLGVCDNLELCNRLYVNEFGFVTIPLMGFGVLVLLILLSYIGKKDLFVNQGIQ